MKAIPFEVLEAGLIMQFGSPVGLETYNRIQDVIKRYPEYFPWENLYNSIDSEVHSAFEEEKSVLYYSFWPRQKLDMKPGEGLIGYMNRKTSERKDEPAKDLKTCLNEMFVEEPKKQREYEKQLKVLWNKHYKKYGLKWKSENVKR